MAFSFNFSKLAALGDKLGFNNARPPLEGFYIYGLLFFVGMLIADVITTQLRVNMLPVGGVTAAKPLSTRMRQPKASSSLFNGIKEKNIFNADHFIPDSLGDKNKGGDFEDSSAPIPTTLPLELVGTIIHGQRDRSVATIQIRGGEIFPVMENEDLEGMAEIRDIVRNKVIFRNTRTRKLEFVEIKEDNSLKLLSKGGGPSVNISTPEKTSFNFQRAEINQYLENLPRVLQDAKAVPYIAPGSGGEVSGFKLIQIKEGSIYEKLGLKRNDILKGVNGENVDSPQKAMELYQALKNSDQIQLEVTRDGVTTTLNYTLE